MSSPNRGILAIDLADAAMAAERAIVKLNMAVDIKAEPGMYLPNSKDPFVKSGSTIVFVNASGIEFSRIENWDGQPFGVGSCGLIINPDAEKPIYIRPETSRKLAFKPNFPNIGYTLGLNLVNRVINNNCYWAANGECDHWHVVADTLGWENLGYVYDEILDCFIEVLETVREFIVRDRWAVYSVSDTAAGLYLTRGTDFRVLEWEKEHGAEFRKSRGIR